MTTRNALNEIDVSQNLNLIKGKRKNPDEESLEVEWKKSNKRPCFTNQTNITNFENSRFKISKRHKIKAKLNRSKLTENKFSCELTPCSKSALDSLISLTSNIPLLNLSFADANQVWNLMLKNDLEYKRDTNMFNLHSSLQPVMRATLLDWLNEVCQAYSLSRQTYYLALDFFDRYLSETSNMPKKRLQLLGITCLFTAAKIEEIFPPKLDRFSFVCDGACNDEEIVAKELVILNTLKWELHPITPIAWLNAYIKIYKCIEKENKIDINESFLIPDKESRLFVQIAHLIDLCTLDSGSLAFSYSVIAASAFYHFTNENLVHQCTGKTIATMQLCIEWMIPFAIAIKNLGFDFLNKFDNDKAMIQMHTISLELLQNAHAIQADIESDKMNMSELSDNSSNLCTPSKLPPTPPKSI